MKKNYFTKQKRVIKEAMAEGCEYSDEIATHLKKRGYKVKSLQWLRMFLHHQMKGDIKVIRNGSEKNRYELR
ncbi:hypothetical protein KAR91_44430 [Candidatus Pacearchaeota archaeon]|nr:hypothetical protein [Candidatus Pacearchaeota archaeon]